MGQQMMGDSRHRCCDPVVGKTQVWARSGRQIQAALVHNAETEAQQIRAKMHGHKVIFRGAVRSCAERQAAPRSLDPDCCLGGLENSSLHPDCGSGEGSAVGGEVFVD